MDLSDILAAEIRATQAFYPEAHQALKNWGLWSRDRRGIFPSISPPSIWDEFVRSKVQDWGEAHEIPEARLSQPDAKSEAPETPQADEKGAVELDTRIHDPDFPAVFRKVLAVAYVSLEIPEYQFPTLARMDDRGYVMFLDGALTLVQEGME